MPKSRPRLLLALAFLLDLFGHCSLLLLISSNSYLSGFGNAKIQFLDQGAWFVFCLAIYPLLGWLFGSYTVLRWVKLPSRILLQRLTITAVFTMVAVAVASWLINPGEQIWLVYRRAQFYSIVPLTIWAFIVRVALRRGILLPEEPRLLFLASESFSSEVLNAWQRVPQREKLEFLHPKNLKSFLSSTESLCHLAIAPNIYSDSEFAYLLTQLKNLDPACVRIMSLTSLFERHQERLPPALLADDALNFHDLPWAAPLSVQAQLKRIADVLLAGVLLLLTSPFIAAAALAIWIEDQGSVFYTQQRSGWLGRPFRVYKLRTMAVQTEDQPARWTLPCDSRITKVGYWLRRLRIDELPQLINVICGEMSLIGPRPERPEHEHQLEASILHYRKRHWMRPGLSGWAQVCSPYASNIDESDLKLSYDLYYLRHFSTWLDMVILFRTIKTILKATGR